MGGRPSVFFFCAHLLLKCLHTREDLTTCMRVCCQHLGPSCHPIEPGSSTEGTARIVKYFVLKATASSIVTSGNIVHHGKSVFIPRRCVSRRVRRLDVNVKSVAMYVRKSGIRSICLGICKEQTTFSHSSAEAQNIARACRLQPTSTLSCFCAHCASSCNSLTEGSCIQTLALKCTRIVASVLLSSQKRGQGALLFCYARLFTR